jgi:hypothetical protein
MAEEMKKKWDDDKYFYEPWDASLDEPLTKEEQKRLDNELDDFWKYILKNNQVKDK